MIKELLYLLLLLTGFGNGLLLSHLCREEVKKWKARFFMMAIVSALLSIGVYFTEVQYKLPIMMALLFMCITALTIVFKGKLMHRYD